MRLPSSFFLFLCLLAFSQCREALPDDAVAYIPEQTTAVMTFKAEQLMDKAAFDEVKQMAFYQEMLAEVRQENPAFAQVLEDPALAGVDLSKNIYMTMVMEEADAPPMAAVLFSIADKSAFESTLDQLDVQYIPAAQSPGSFSSPSSALIWNETVGILGMGPEQADMKARVEALLRTDQRESIGNNKNFRKALAEDYDVMQWFTAEYLVDKYQLDKIGRAARFSAEDLRDNHARALLHFEAGKVRGEMDFFLSDKLRNDMDMVFLDRSRMDFRKKLPSEELIMVSTMALDLSGINQLLVEYHVQGASEQPLRQFGISWEDIREALSGEMAVAAYRAVDTPPLSMVRVLVAMGIRDQSKLEGILQAGKDGGWLLELGDNRYQWMNTEEVDSLGNSRRETMAEIWIEDEVMYLSDQADIISTLQAGDYTTGTGIMSERGEMKSSQAFSMIIDAAHLPGGMSDEEDLQLIPFDYLMAGGDETTMEGIAIMEDREQNSLRQFFQWFNNMYQQKKAADEKMKEMSEQDSSS